MITTCACLREFLKGLRAGAGDRLGQLEVLVVLALAEVLRAKQLLRADDLRAVAGRRVRPAARVFSRFAAGSGEQAVWISPTLTMRPVIRSGDAVMASVQALAELRAVRSRMLGAAA